MGNHKHFNQLQSQSHRQIINNIYPDREKFLKFDDARELLKEGDVLLFRGRGIVSFFIKIFGEGRYSHVGVASSVGTNGGKIWECVEFREGKGGRAVNLRRYCKTHNGIIDVYRPVDKRIILGCNENGIYRKEIVFNGRQLTNIMRAMTGLPYGWKRIFRMLLFKMPFLKTIFNINYFTNDNIDLIYPVCSTALASGFSKIGYDLINNKNDNYMEPNDFARSPLLFYVFTILD